MPNCLFSLKTAVEQQQSRINTGWAWLLTSTRRWSARSWWWAAGRRTGCPSRCGRRWRRSWWSTSRGVEQRRSDNKLERFVKKINLRQLQSELIKSSTQPSIHVISFHSARVQWAWSPNWTEIEQQGCAKKQRELNPLLLSFQPFV